MKIQLKILLIFKPRVRGGNYCKSSFYIKKNLNETEKF